jgi:NAD(P)-dependent dehydrogenase (short-subunit alcohol dehydrogenase family)
MTVTPDRPDVNGWQLTDRAVWVVGAGAVALGEGLRVAGAQVTVSSASSAAGAWAEEVDLPGGRLDGLILVLDDPGDQAPPGARRNFDAATVIGDRLESIFSIVRAAARRMNDLGGAVVIVAFAHWAHGRTWEPVSLGLETLVRSLAIALGSTGITVNLIRVQSVAPEGWLRDSSWAKWGPVAYLISRDTTYLTGQVLFVDHVPWAPAR